MTRPDFTISATGGIALIVPLTRRAFAWITDHVQAEPWQWHGGALATEPRMVGPIADSMRADGLRIGGGK